jgi:cytochrome bd-type quinol oxidase subunit 2
VRLIHLGVGIAGVLAFLATGLYMARNFPAAYASGEEIRYMYRANHVYLLLASLVNVALGCYWPGARPGWRGKLALAGAWLLLAALPVLLAAFFVEPPRGSPERGLTFLGVLLTLLGAAAQLPSRR